MHPESAASQINQLLAVFSTNFNCDNNCTGGVSFDVLHDKRTTPDGPGLFIQWSNNATDYDTAETVTCLLYLTSAVLHV